MQGPQEGRHRGASWGGAGWGRSARALEEPSWAVDPPGTPICLTEHLLHICPPEIIAPLWQLEKPRHKEVECLAQGPQQVSRLNYMCFLKHLPKHAAPPPFPPEGPQQECETLEAQPHSLWAALLHPTLAPPGEQRPRGSVGPTPLPQVNTLRPPRPRSLDMRPQSLGGDRPVP